MAARHLIIGGGTAGMNAIRTIREEEGERSEIVLVSAERPYSRMVLPYYLDRSIAESHVFTATPRDGARHQGQRVHARRRDDRRVRRLSDRHGLVGGEGAGGRRRWTRRPLVLDPRRGARGPRRDRTR